MQSKSTRLIRTSGKVWIFQANPKQYDLAADLKDKKIGDEDSWTVTRFWKEIHTGDIAILWQSGKDAGVYALSQVISEPYERDWKPTEAELKERPYLKNRWWVKIRYTNILPKPITRASLKVHPVLGSLDILRFAQSSNFRVKPEEWKAICSLIPCSGIEQEISPHDERDELKLPPRTTLKIQRVIRDSKVGKELKQLYNYQCQVCGTTIELPDGKRYAEIHHLQPVGKPHNGRDGKPNTIVVCPQHHAMFDLGAIAINPKTYMVRHWGAVARESLTIKHPHRLDKSCLNYHYRKLFKGAKK